ncbi:MAG: crotonase/enoyl-CoA hydratase family protein [Bacteroidota bacterium]|nr:crotonase/enoyl-CoA hydratase family protein [Bacteroidota bacterium]
MKTINLHIENKVAHVTFNRPEVANALNEQAWIELYEVFSNLDAQDEVRVAVLSGEGKHFCSGIDLSMLEQIMFQETSCEGRHKEKLLQKILKLQDAVTQIEKCRKPVIAAIHGACVGAGLDIAAACDMRYASNEAFFSIKEIDMGMVADLGSLQRLSKILSEGLLRELAYTGRKVPAIEAKSLGIINSIYNDHNALLTEVQAIAGTIASKSPLAIRGIKTNMNYSRDHSVEEGLQFVANWNAAMLYSNDIKEVFEAIKEGRQPQFKD